MNEHPDFVRAPQQHRWSGHNLRGLRVHLEEQAKTLERGGRQRAWRVLRSGALVSMWLEPDGTRRIRIARSERPKTDQGPARWDSELAIFQKHMGFEGWTRIDDAEASGIAVVFVERAGGCVHCGGPVPAEVRIAGSDTCHDCAAMVVRGLVLCARCRKSWVRPDPAYDVMHCNECAFEVGKAYDREVQARTARAS